MTHCFSAMPHIKLPAKKKTLEKISPARRPKMSVSFPLKGCSAALATRYAVAIHEINVNDWNESDMGVARVAMMVESELRG
jgi:hypothetical protein